MDFDVRQAEAGFREDNHFVAKGYLKGWAESDGMVWAYRTLVSRPSVAQWRQCRPRSVAYHKHLYAHCSFGATSDAVERWLADEVDNPICPVLEKVAAERPLTGPDWDVLVRFFAASQVRTPSYLIRLQMRPDQQVTAMLDNLLRKVTATLVPKKATSEPNLGGSVVSPPFRSRLRKNEDGTGTLEIEYLRGRQEWLTTIHRIVSRTYKQLLRLNWTILRAPDGMAWMTSDNPAASAWVSSEGNVQFGLPWGLRDNHLFIALSPRHLLFTRVGARVPLKYSYMPEKDAQFIRESTVMNAHRLVFASSSDEWTHVFRPRRVDPAAVAHEAEQWAKWNAEQSKAERDLRDESTWGIAKAAANSNAA